MEKMADICDSAKLHYSDETFKEEISREVIRGMLDYLDEEEVTFADLIREEIKEGLFTAIGLIPILGDVISAAEGLLNPLTEYMTKREKQCSLPFFINDLRKV